MTEETKNKIIDLLIGMSNDSKSASYKCEKELCKMIEDTIKIKHSVEESLDRYIDDYPHNDKIYDIEFDGYWGEVPEIFECNDCTFKFETKFFDYDWELYFNRLKREKIDYINSDIETAKLNLKKLEEKLDKIKNITYIK